jgi:hypothetical protein
VEIWASAASVASACNSISRADRAASGRATPTRTCPRPRLARSKGTQRDRPPGKVFRHGKTRVRDGISRVGRLPMQRLGVVDSLGTPCCFSDAAKPSRFRRQAECVHSQFGRGTSIVRLIARMALAHSSSLSARLHISCWVEARSNAALNHSSC